MSDKDYEAPTNGLRGSTIKEGPYHYFRFSQYVDDVALLKVWYDHFRDRNIPCIIMQGFPGKPLLENNFSLWVAGYEWKSQVHQSKPNSELLTGWVLLSYSWDTESIVARYKETLAEYRAFLEVAG